MKKTWKIVTGIGVAAIVLGGIAACGHHYRSDPQARAEYMSSKVASKLDLSDEQNQKLKAATSLLLEMSQRNQAHRDARRDQILALLDHPVMDQQQVLTIVGEETRRINEQAPQVVAAIGEIYDSLTPEQRTKLKSELQHWSEHGRRWHGH